MKSQNTRQSNMELLRIVSMLCIIIYHIFLFGLEPLSSEPLYKALQIPFHIGVPCFVLISGYFGIHFSFKGLFRLMGMAYTYAFLVELIGVLFLDYPIQHLREGIFVIGYNRHWFLTTYLWLYLLSPMINKFLENITSSKRVYLFVVLMFATFYAGHVMQHEPSLMEGKNILNFMLLYLVGNTVRRYQTEINKIPLWLSPIVFVLVSCVTTYVGITKIDYQVPVVGNVWYRFFGYDSIGMYLNATLVFLFFSQLKIQSKFINWMSGSVFAMYLLSVAFIWDFIRSTSVRIESHYHQPITVIVMCIGLAVFFMLFCVCIDKLMSPIWNMYRNFGARLDSKYKLFV